MTAILTSDQDGKRWLLGRILARANAEGASLAAQEIDVLMQSAESPDPRPLPLNDESDEEFIERVGALLRRSFDAETGEAKEMYRESVALLSRGEHYMSWVAAEAGISAPRPKWLGPFRQVGLVALLVIPAIFGLLIGAVGLSIGVGWMAAKGTERIRMALVGVMFTAFGVVLLALWRRERRG